MARAGQRVDHAAYEGAGLRVNLPDVTQVTQPFYGQVKVIVAAGGGRGGGLRVVYRHDVISGGQKKSTEKTSARTGEVFPSGSQIQVSLTVWLVE